MKLVHYSSKPVDGRELRVLPQGKNSFKPRGLWVSDDDCEDNWLNWCVRQEFNLGNLVCVHDVVLVAGANVNIISSGDELDDLTERFGVEDRSYSLNWARMREFWDGIVITPYIWSRRIDDGVGWYYTWDCASGCIWHPRAIESVKLRKCGR